MKQVELAKKAGITEGMVSFILSGERRPSWDVAKKLAKATGTDPYLWMEYKHGTDEADFHFFISRIGELCNALASSRIANAPPSGNRRHGVYRAVGW